MHLPTLDIRVEQKGNRAMKWEIHVGFLLKPVYISGLSVLRRGQIRSLPVSSSCAETRSGHFRFSSGLSMLRRGQRLVPGGMKRSS